MKITKMVFSILCLIAMSGCALLDNNSDNDGSTDNVTYILCEGEYGAPNASLWSINLNTKESAGPIHWDQNNPLGDTGQSLKIANGKLYIVVNNSHSVEVMDLANEKPEYESTLYVPNASPRYLEVVEDKGFLTSWGLNGILVFDTKTLDILDTIQLNGWPEMILNTNWGMFVTVPMRSYSEYTDLVYQIDPLNYETPIDTFKVVPGPISMVQLDDQLYVGSTYYDSNWQTYSGSSKIDLSEGTVMNNDYGQIYGIQKSLIAKDGKVFRLTSSGLNEIGSDLSLLNGGNVVNVMGGYSADFLGDKLFIGVTDYSAPDSVYVYNENFELDSIYQVKALPTDFEYFSQME